MARRKADVRIGYRAAEEALRLSGYSVANAVMLLGAERKIVYNWANGDAPTAIYLQRLYEMGADVGYILTGRRTGGGGRAA